MRIGCQIIVADFFFCPPRFPRSIRPGSLPSEVREGGSRRKGSALCDLVTKDLFVFLSEVKKKNCAKNFIQLLIWIKPDTLVSSESEAMGGQHVSVPQEKGVARTSQPSDRVYICV